jgi:hypothetical protein
MKGRTIGSIVAGIVGSAVGAWYIVRRRAAGGPRGRLTPAHERGTVIFDNTPAAAPGTFDHTKPATEMTDVR